jgi:phosphoserine phosphatase
MTNMIADETVAKSNVLSVFDFDGTLTHHDSFIPFLRFAFGKRYLRAVWCVWRYRRSTACAVS